MNKKYAIEVPIYSSSIEHLIELNRLEDIDIVMYGGVPNSVLNGGRLNLFLDGLFIWNRLLFSLTKKQLSKALSKFYNAVTKANQNGIPFRIAFTNMFVSQEELNEENLYPVKWLVESSQKYGVKNGIIITNKLLEDFIRQKYKDKLVYVSSCTKYYSPDKVLTPQETLSMYLEDSLKYDFIVMTPQDSRRENLLKEVLRASMCGVTAICNCWCAFKCNSYHHYKCFSNINKKSLLNIGYTSFPFLVNAITFQMLRGYKCPLFLALFQPFRNVHIEKTAKMQLAAGIVSFKVGRGLGADFLDRLVSLILEFKAS
ncbi:MAG: hypothetical protein A3K83_02520 [Omnitrophica WOR_2 bacterium RBG_13_44_8b]|nr:MAG: hypothetical protein A3K83_02520 [Omnitrophica WOR_2 bacterium RBG_13_44_8b]